jgi:hypothetical protein
VDDEAFERTLRRLASEGEEAASGHFAPLDAQRREPSVAIQWFIDSYARARSTAHVEGLIGRNTALSRPMVEWTGGFSGPVRIGMDYYLARQVVRRRFRRQTAFDKRDGAPITGPHMSRIRYTGSM